MPHPKVHSDGKLLSPGRTGKGPGSSSYRTRATDKRGGCGRDRHNNRIQIIDPTALSNRLTRPRPSTNIFIVRTRRSNHGTASALSIYDIEGNLLTQFGNEGRTEADPLFVALHSVAVDSRGDLYVAEVMGLHQGTPFLETRKTRMIQKFIRKR
jgi:hypothetical protein